MNNQNERNGLQEIIDKAIQEMAAEAGERLDISDINLAEFCRKTGLSRSKARTLKAKGFKVTPHGRCGQHADVTVMTGYEQTVDDSLRAGVTNSEVIFAKIAAQGYSGSISSVKAYIRAHADLIPAKRQIVEPQGSRGMRFFTAPGEAFQMDWGFVNVEDSAGAHYRLACFCMVCHHCASAYVEFFPSARQENLFIGMIHAFLLMGVPEYVLTDNMKSVVLYRDIEGKPVWQKDYAAFMACAGFKTKLAKPRHPYTKGKVERLVRFVKDNFLAGRIFADATDLNEQALLWCAEQAGKYRRALDLIPADTHESLCRPRTSGLERTEELACYLIPLRRISFDGFVCFEGRRFGVPYWYTQKTCRIHREGRFVHIYTTDLSREIAVHPVTWTRRDSLCADQYLTRQPEEKPSMPVKCTIAQIEPPRAKPAFAKFDFGRDE